MKSRFLVTPLFSLLFFTTLLPLVPPQGSLQDVFNATNSFRKSKRLDALVMRDDLNAIAQKHSDDMASGRMSLGHEGFDKRQLQMKQKIKGASSFGENVAYGPTTGQEAVNGWKRSPGHRRNLLGAYRYIGIGIARDRRGNLYYTQIFVD